MSIVHPASCLAAFLLLLGAFGCGNSALPGLDSGKLVNISLGNDVSIGSLQRSQQGSTVTLRGRVIHRAPLLGSSAYELQDATGRIWVVGQEPATIGNGEVSVRGILRYQSLLMNGQDYGSVYLEQQ